MTVRITRLAMVLATVGAVLAGWGPGSARADWTTYHRDAVRSGVDTSSPGSGPFASAWTSPSLAGSVYGEPLVHNGLVVVATENNDVYALDEATGAVVWHKNIGTAVPATQLPCGNIKPTVGITSTPVIDPATNRVFVVADTWDGSNASSVQHRLVGFNLADGSPLAGLPLVVDPTGSDPKTLLQRTALALDGGNVVIGYGGNAGDCGSYHGWLVAAPETGGSLMSFEVQKDGQGGAIWGAGNGPAVDSSGNIWAATGNGKASLYEFQQSVLKLDGQLNLLDHWAPSNWSSLDSTDTDLGSSDPLLLPGGLVFQIGKAGVGYLLSTSALGGTGGIPVFQAQACPLTRDSSFGGAVYYAGVIYVSCANGLRALSLNTSSRSYAAVAGWQVQAAAIGPPIVAGGLVWVAAYNAATLYGLDPGTGHVVVAQSTPALVHFTTPSASDGKLFLATGQTVHAYKLGSGPAVKPPSISEAFGVASVPVGGSTSLNMTISNPNGSKVLTGVGFTDTLPGGLVVAATPGATNSCGGTWSPSGGAGSLALSGASVGAGSSCSVSVVVTGETAGAKVNTTGAVVSTEGGAGNSTSATLVVGPPTVTSVSPSSGPSTGGNTVTINGSNFVPGATVAFGSNAGTAVAFLSGTQLTAVTPANAAGTSVDIRVTTPGGSSATSGSDLYAYVPPSPMTLQARVSVHGSSRVTTPPFNTTAAGEVLVAFVSADGPAGAGRQQATVSGAGLSWTLVKRTNGQSGDAEVWVATAPGVLSNATVTSAASAPGFGEDLTVIAMKGVKGIGATAAGSAPSSAPSVSLTTAGASSLVFAVGHDWDNAIARTLPSGWVLLDQWLNTSARDTFWSQYTNTPTGPAGSVVTVNDTAPTTDRWNLVAVELLNSSS